MRFELPDIHGTARVKLVPIGAAYHYAEEGLNMYGGAQVLDSRSDVVAGSGYNNEYQYADQMLLPDPATAQIVPWQPGHARASSALRTRSTARRGSRRRGSCCSACSRTAAEMGYGIKTGMEYENYFLQPPTARRCSAGTTSSTRSGTSSTRWCSSCWRQLPKVGVDLITANAEYGPGQFELNFGPGDGLEGPDKSYTYKNAVKEIAHKHELIGTFMSKPINGLRRLRRALPHLAARRGAASR